jgi:soluble lytic murein transglycosylase
MRSLPQTISWVILGLLALAAGPTTAEETDTLLAQRAAFQEAEQALQRGKTSHYHKLKASLKDYPLYPYLEYAELQRRLPSAKNSEIRSFLKSHAGTPLAGMLQRSWLDQLARQGRWQTFLQFYQPSSNARRTCHYLHALIKTGKSQEALGQVEPLWLYGRSQPSACDPVFDTWRQAGRLTTELTWQRIELALEARQTRLARYLDRFLPPQEKVWLERWLEVYRNPKLILQHKPFRGTHPYKNQILLHGIRRLARKDGFAAFQGWNILKGRYPFTPAQYAQAERTLAFALIRDRHPDTLTYLAQITPDQGDLDLHEARLRAALMENDWARLLDWLEQLPEAYRTSERWSYWQARALAASGQQQEADRLYRRVARERSYYGFMAADRLGGDYHLDHTPLEIEDPSLERQTTSHPGIQRARELYALDRLVPARREWEAATRSMDDKQLQAASKLAHDWGWHDRAIFSLARTGYWDDLALRFPLKHRQHVEHQAKNQQLESAWVFAILRQESAFISDARSHAGALGLMQLMPRTAHQVARRLPKRPSGPVKELLLQPDMNIRLGTAYLRQVLNELNQHQVLATAAYNAGPHRVRSWLPEQETPADLWVETVPFKETRTYLRRVLAYTVIYEQRLGLKPTRLQQRMPPVKTPGSVAKRLKQGNSDQG